MRNVTVFLLVVIAALLAYELWDQRQQINRLAEAQFQAYYETQVAPKVREQEYRAKKDAERAAVDATYRERRAKERETKIAEFSADPTRVLKQLRSLIQSGRFDEACALAADYDGVINDDLKRLTQTIESKVGVRCSNQ